MSARGAGPSRGGGGGSGGGRGRGRGGGGRGGGFSRGAGGMSSHLMGTLSWTDLAELDKARPNRHAYPPVDAKPVLHKASDRERRIVRRQLDFLRAQQSTPWWPLTGNELSNAGIAAQTNGSDAATTSTSAAKAVPAPVSLKRGAAYIPRYSDKFRRTALDISSPSVIVNGDAKMGKARKSDAAEVQSPDFMATLQRDAFPVNLWRSYVQGESRRQERRQEASAASRRRRGDWKRIVEGVELTGGEDAASDGLPSEEEEEAAVADEYEDDVEDDYAENYFDNGEDDDTGDAEAGQEADVYD